MRLDKFLKVSRLIKRRTDVYKRQESDSYRNGTSETGYYAHRMDACRLPGGLLSCRSVFRGTLEASGKLRCV